MLRDLFLAHPPPERRDEFDAFAAERLSRLALSGDLAGADLSAAPDGWRICAMDRCAGQGGDDPATMLHACTIERFGPTPGGVGSASVRARVSPVFEWAALGLEDLEGRPVPCPADGPFALAWWAPWCPDCAPAWSELVSRAAAREGRAALVGAFAAASEIRSFLDARGPAPTVWREPSEKRETDRLRTFHAFLRRLQGDPRKWGLPVWRELVVADGRFVVHWT